MRFEIDRKIDKRIERDQKDAMNDSARRVSARASQSAPNMDDTFY